MESRARQFVVSRGAAMILGVTPHHVGYFVQKGTLTLHRTADGIKLYDVRELSALAQQRAARTKRKRGDRLTLIETMRRNA